MLRFVRFALPRCSVALLANVDRVGVADAALVGELGVQDDQARLVDVGDVGRVLGADVHAGERAAGLRLTLRGASAISAYTSSMCSRSAWSLARREMLACRSYQYLPDRHCRSTSRGRRARRARNGSCPARRPGIAVPRNTRWVSRPLCAEPIVGAAPKNTVRASRRVSERCPNSGLSASILTGSAFGPSTSASMTAFHESCRYWVSSEFTVAVADRDRAGHDQRRLVLADPQRVDDGVHQPQHAAGALEALEARPVLVEAVEQLGMDRVGLLDAVLVAAVARLAREVVGVAVVHLDEAAGGRADRGERVGVGRGEQPLADDVVGLVRGRGPPLVGDAPHDVLQPLERLEAVGAADLLGVAGDRVGVVAALRRRDRDGQQHARRALDRLGQRLRERELVVERARRRGRRGRRGCARRRPTRRSGSPPGRRRRAARAAPPRAGCGWRPRSRPSRTPPGRRAARRARPRSC